MKKLVLLISTLILSFGAICQNRPTLHGIIFADTYDDKIGPGTDVSKTKFGDFLYEIAGQIDYEDDFVFYPGDQCRKATLMNVLDNFSCDTSDIVVFCYMGHGGRSEADTSLFPQMCLHEKYQKDYVPLEYVKERLAAHGARVTWVIGDCCNSYDEFIEPKTYPAGPTMLPGAATNLANQLFIEFTGVVTMCASKPGTFGWSNNVTGMYFNNALIGAIENANLNSLIPGQPWQSVMNTVMKSLAGHTFYDKEDPTRTPYKMEPRYRIEPRRHNQKPPVGPKPDQTVQRALSDLSNRNKHGIERMRMVEHIQQSYFAANAMVRTVSKDNIAYGDFYAIEKYLYRLSRAENIINVIVRTVRKDDAEKITYIEVHEIYTELKK